MSSAIFDPVVVRDRLKTLLKGREKVPDSHKNKNEWLVNWQMEWTQESVQARVDRWEKAGCVGTQAQMEFVSHVCEYMVIFHRATFGYNGGSKALPEGFPIYGPLFTPPTIGYHNLTKAIASNVFKKREFPDKHLLSVDDVLIEPVHILSPIYFPKLGLLELKCPSPDCKHKLERNGFTSSGFRSMYGLKSNFKVLGMDFKCREHGKFSTTSPDKFWNYFDCWSLRDLPHFNERSAYTRELYDFVCEFRLQSSIGQITESIHQLHLLETHRLQSAWLDYAIANKAKLEKNKYQIEFPQVLQISAEKSLEINPAPSETSIRCLYDHFLKNQREKESAQYSRTLAGRILGMDSTVKLANKANIYVSTKSSDNGSSESDHQVNTSLTVFNPFEGGMLTAVNEDKELVFWELLRTNSPSEMLAPLLEYAERCNLLGVNFKEIGEICVDRCCDFRPAIERALPNISVVQDLMHLKARILDTIPKKSIYRDAVSSELTKALVVHSASQGQPAVYHPAEEQYQRLLSVYEKYNRIGSALTSASQPAFENQFAHIRKGCLQRRHPDLPSHTSGNENWHGRLNALSRGDASSLPTIVALVTDAVLRLNLNVKINNLSQPPDSMSRQFRAKANGFHHLFLLNHILRQTEELTGVDQPVLLNVCPEHKLGLVPRDFDLYKDKSSRIQALRHEFKGDGKADPLIDQFIEQVTLNGEADFLNPSLNEKRSYSQLLDESEDVPNSEFITGHSSEYQNECLEDQSFNKRIKLVNDHEKISTAESTFCENYSLSDNQIKLIPGKPGIININETRPNPRMQIEQLIPESRTAAKLSTVLVTQSASEYIAANTITPGESSHWRFAACRVIFGWTSAMSPQQWKEAAIHYNSPHTFIHPSFYENHDFPHDPIYRDADTLKKYCLEFEKSVWRWKHQQDDGKELKAWIKKQLTVLPPNPSGALYYAKPTKTGKQAKVKICRRCNQPRDSQKQNHPRDNCSDGFFSWDKIPFPLPSPPNFPSLTFRLDGKLCINAAACISAFQKALHEKTLAHNSSLELKLEWENILVFERLARKNTDEGIESAVLQGQHAYNFTTLSRFRSGKR